MKFLIPDFWFLTAVAWVLGLRVWFCQRRVMTLQAAQAAVACGGDESGVEFVRRRGSETARFTGTELREIAEDLTGLCLRTLKDTKGRRDLYLQRRAIAKAMRRVRTVNERFCYAD